MQIGAQLLAHITATAFRDIAVGALAFCGARPESCGAFQCTVREESLLRRCLRLFNFPYIYLNIIPFMQVLEFCYFFWYYNSTFFLVEISNGCFGHTYHYIHFNLINLVIVGKYTTNYIKNGCVLESREKEHCPCDVCSIQGRGSFLLRGMNI